MGKIIGLDQGTRSRFILSFVTAIVDFLAVFGIITFNDSQINAIKNLALVVITAIVWYVGFYFNECTTEENCELTGELRARNDFSESEDLSDEDEDDDYDGEEDDSEPEEMPEDEDEDNEDID